MTFLVCFLVIKKMNKQDNEQQYTVRTEAIKSF